MTNHITFWGDDLYRGAYVLWLRVAADLRLSFGQFQHGHPVIVPAGAYAYIGSAMGQAGATALAGRLLRHATRTGDKPPHALRAQLVEAFAAAGPGSGAIKLPAAKRLHWHIDYLLDEMAVTLAGAAIIRTAARVESDVARSLAAIPGVAPLQPGLGASDAPGETHLLRLPNANVDWQAIIGSILGM